MEDMLTLEQCIDLICQQGGQRQDNPTKAYEIDRTLQIQIEELEKLQKEMKEISYYEEKVSSENNQNFKQMVSSSDIKVE